MSLKSLSADHAVRIRIENTGSVGERDTIRAINAAAFGTTDEAELVDKLRAGEHALVSLVALLEGRIVGHIMFSRMWINMSSGLVSAAA